MTAHHYSLYCSAGITSRTVINTSQRTDNSSIDNALDSNMHFNVVLDPVRDISQPSGNGPTRHGAVVRLDDNKEL